MLYHFVAIVDFPGEGMSTVELNPMVETCRFQAGWYRYFGSAFYGFLMERCAVACEQHGPIRELFASIQDYSRRGGYPVQLLAGVHRLVLQGKAAELARFYPSAGGAVDFAPAWTAFEETVRRNLEWLSQFVLQPVQINDVDRSAGLLGGFGLIAQQTGLPLRLLEIGASGGLNLYWDRYGYQWKGASWGDHGSGVQFKDVFRNGSPALPSSIAVMERLGCDSNPVDVAGEEGKLALLAYMFPDEKDRMERTRAAMATALQEPCKIQKAQAADWLDQQLKSPVENAATVIFHSMVWQYMTEREQHRATKLIHTAGARATLKAPLAWLKMESGQNRPFTDGYEVRLQIYPGFREQLIAMFHQAWHVPAVEWMVGNLVSG